MMAMSRRRRRRGYPQAILIGLDGNRATLWTIFSESIRPGKTLTGEGDFPFYQSLIDVLRPSLKEGIKTILIVTSDEKEYQRFLNHVKKHQGWLLNGWSLNTVTFEHVPGSAMNIKQVRDLINKHGFQEKLQETHTEGSQQVMNLLEKKLNDPEGIETLYFSLNEVEQVVYGEKPIPEYILVTDQFREKQRRRIQRLFQIANNKNVKTMIIKNETPAGARITQLGGLVCLTRK